MNLLNDKELIDLTRIFYEDFCEKWGEPKMPLQQLLVGNINYNVAVGKERWGECIQIMNKSNIYYDSSLLSEEIDTIFMVIAHELAHVWVGCNKGHGLLFKSFLKKFEDYMEELLTYN